jgi:predicted metal-binding membrane protein
MTSPRPDALEQSQSAGGASRFAHVRRPAVWGVLAASLVGWILLAWMAIDMDSQAAQLMMPTGADWDLGNLVAIGLMWAVMMAAMMLPSALPMVLAFVDLSERAGQRARSLGFVSAYVLAWIAFSAVAVAAQWALQAADLIDPMIVSTSSALNVALLAIAGVYQFSPLKRVCLAHCRSPIAFLVGEWRTGARGSFEMGWRHGVQCLGCCWALMALLFVGGVMNLAWIAALSIAVAIEKLAPRGEWIAAALGVALIGAGAAKLLVAV